MIHNKIIFSILFSIISCVLFFSGSTSFAALHVNCFDSWSTVSYQNMYHTWSGDRIAQDALSLCYWRNLHVHTMSNILSWNTGSHIQMDWRDSAEYLEQVFPIYNPKQKNPILLQVVISGTGYNAIISRPFKVALGYPDHCMWPRLSYNWLDIICGRMMNHDPERQALYTISQQEPFKSAPQIQFYMYKLWMLLVARDVTGKVTHWAYEKQNIDITDRWVQYFLGDKWYHP